MMKFLKYLFIILPVVVFISVGCVKNETCISSNNLMVIELYHADTDSTYSAVSVDSLTVFFKDRADSLIYDNVKDVSTIDIPLSDTTEFLNIVIKINDGYDEILLDYRPYFVFRSTECGVINRYEIIDAHPSTDRIDSLNIYNEDIDESELVNLYMFVNLD